MDSSSAMRRSRIRFASCSQTSFTNQRADAQSVEAIGQAGLQKQAPKERERARARVPRVSSRPTAARGRTMQGTDQGLVECCPLGDALPKQESGDSARPRTHPCCGGHAAMAEARAGGRSRDGSSSIDSGRLQHRSERALLTHSAPTSGAWRESDPQAMGAGSWDVTATMAATATIRNRITTRTCAWRCSRPHVVPCEKRQQSSGSIRIRGNFAGAPALTTLLRFHPSIQEDRRATVRVARKSAC